jgi:hypothetical protein
MQRFSYIFSMATTLAVALFPVAAQASISNGANAVDLIGQ